MKLQNKIVGAGLALLATSQSALASTYSGGSDSFDTFYSTVKGWATSGLGLGLATTMLLMGGAIGVAKNSPMPALTGIAGAAFLKWGPDIIQNIMTGGALI